MNKTGRKDEKKVTVILTEYRNNSHAEMILGRLFGAMDYTPRIHIASLYIDQFPFNDTGRREAEKYGVPILPTISEAIKVGCEQNPVNGVIIIGEHGDYPWNERRQKMYPRRRFIEETLQALDQLNLRVPIFSDKHLSYNIKDTLWIYNQIKKRNIPFMGGSSIPLTEIEPSLEIEREISEVFVVSWLGVESYGFHGMEVLEAVAEQRSGGETGVESIQTLEGKEVWSSMDSGMWPEELMMQALAIYPGLLPGHPRDYVKDPTLFIINYLDGTRGYVIQLEEFVNEWLFSFRCNDGKIASAKFAADSSPPFRHFEVLTQYIENLILSGQSPIPMERTLLTTGLINLGMESLYQGKKLSTPELHIQYRV